ncbi:hypothetical protein EsDP_00000720 [Epichloe bromicola]|uniref:Myb-like domain-containing protein n=1 Tax=Epichloe bromicola TaxID=79588 RepID=A0ABQ0CFS1_9HYPO
MVTTRSSAAPPTDERAQTAAESSDKSQRGRQRSRVKVATSSQKKKESKTIRKRLRRDTDEPKLPQVQKTTIPMRPKGVRQDIDADAPDDLSFSDMTNKQASVKGKKQNNSKTDKTEGETLPTSIETPTEIAEASRERRKLIERERLAREARDKEEEIICEERQRQMMLFIASTRMPWHEGQERHIASASHEGYHQKHGWYIWEDEMILDMIRKVKSPDAKALVEQFPWRTVAEVKERVKDLRARMKLKFETQGRQPPKWCYN